MLIPLTLIIVIIILKHRSCVQQEKKVLGEAELMLSESTQEVDETTKNFLSFLSEEFRRIYPEYKTKSYLVPSLYININTNKSVKFAGEDMYVTHPPEERFLRYNMAMHRVLGSLRLLAKHREEVMFVITQYNYDSYLNSIKQEFVEHKEERRQSLWKL
ncbi:uncharacterized protein LOC112575701 [Pomacea canaliculata]|uniref:uncharacterized protein LOC112575701 n=1 Tax=Pomacea canaliculata TaxID=400727 RepID=UPI000D7256C6|nr:uncharacterized protein LOC112575701 [Pomacea canaliculata]